MLIPSMVFGQTVAKNKPQFGQDMKIFIFHLFMEIKKSSKN